MGIALILLLTALLPLPARALSLQDLVDQGSFTAGEANFSNFRASTDILTDNPGSTCCTFSTLDTIHAELLPEGLRLSEIQGRGRTDSLSTDRFPSDFVVRLSFDSDHPVTLTDVTLSGGWSPFTTPLYNNTFIGPSSYHVTASLGIQISPRCSHIQPPGFPCEFFFQQGTMTVNTLVPEPSTVTLLVVGMTGLAIRRYFA